MHPSTGQRVIQELRQKGTTKREHIRRVRTNAAQKIIDALMTTQVNRKGKTLRGLTQEQIAEKIGLTQAVISRYRAGLNPPAIPTLKALLDLARRRDLTVRGLTNGWREL